MFSYDVVGGFINQKSIKFTSSRTRVVELGISRRRILQVAKRNTGSIEKLPVRIVKVILRPINSGMAFEKKLSYIALLSSSITSGGREMRDQGMYVYPMNIDLVWAKKHEYQAERICESKRYAESQHEKFSCVEFALGVHARLKSLPVIENLACSKFRTLYLIGNCNARLEYPSYYSDVWNNMYKCWVYMKCALSHLVAEVHHVACPPLP